MLQCAFLSHHSSAWQRKPVRSAHAVVDRQVFAALFFLLVLLAHDRNGPFRGILEEPLKSGAA
jgi:hypothetical protein